MMLGAVLVVAVIWSNTGLGFMVPNYFYGPTGMIICTVAHAQISVQTPEEFQVDFPADQIAAHGTIEEFEATCFPMLAKVPEGVEPVPPFGSEDPLEGTLAL